jgi:hypothetical protein
MKSIIIYTLLFAIFLQVVGCYSFYPLEKNENIKDYLNPDNRLEFRLKNGDYIKASSDSCFFIDKPGNYIFGRGTLLNQKTQNTKVFQGEVKMELVDSVINNAVNSKKYVFCYLQDSKIIIFEEKDVVIITPETAPEFWIFFNYDSPKIIYNTDIKSIQVEKLNTEKTVVVGVICAALIVFFVISTMKSILPSSSSGSLW